MATSTDRELTDQGLRQVMGLGPGEQFAVQGWLPLLPRGVAPKSAHLDLRPRERDDPLPPSALWSLLVYCAFILVCAAPILIDLLGRETVARALGAGLVGILCYVMAIGRRATEFVVSAEGIEVRRGRRCDLIAWADVEAVQNDGKTGLISVPRHLLLVDLSTAGADRLYNAASRVISAREHGEVVRLADWTPDTALSLTSDGHDDGAEERGISLARDEEG